MGVLTCKLFTVPPDDRLERCALRDEHHITPGSAGDHVKCIQIALNELTNVFLPIDGIYGPKTEAAIRNLQRSIQASGGTVEVDGVVGPQTWQALVSGLRQAAPLSRVA